MEKESTEVGYYTNRNKREQYLMMNSQDPTRQIRGTFKN